MFTANSGKRRRWRSAENLGPTLISLQAKGPTLQWWWYYGSPRIWNPSPSTSRPVWKVDFWGSCPGGAALSPHSLAGEAAVPGSSSDPLPWRETQPFRAQAPLRWESRYLACFCLCMWGKARVEFRGSAGLAQSPHKVHVFLSCPCHPLPLSHTVVTISHSTMTWLPEHQSLISLSLSASCPPDWE